MHIELKKIRERQGVSIAKAAREMGYSEGLMRKLETKDYDPRLSLMKDVIQYYALDDNFFFRDFATSRKVKALTRHQRDSVLNQFSELSYDSRLFHCLECNKPLSENNKWNLHHSKFRLGVHFSCVCKAVADGRITIDEAEGG